MRPSKTVTLSDGSTVDVLAPGPAAHMTALGVLPTAALIAASKGDQEGAEAIAAERGIEPDRLAEQHVKFVCACTRNPMLSPVYPAPKGCVYYDDLDQGDWQKIEAAVTSLRKEAEDEVRPTLASAGESR